MPKFQRVRQRVPGGLSFGGWFIVSAVLTAQIIPSSQGCLRAAVRVARRPIQSGVEVVEDLAQVPHRKKSMPEFRHKDLKVHPLDREPSHAVHMVQLDVQRRWLSLGEIPARAGTRSGDTIPNSATRPSRLRELGRNGGRYFSRTLGSFRSYRRQILTTIPMRWSRFKTNHLSAVKYAKWVCWLSGIAVSVGSAVSFPVELYRTFHTLNHTDAEIMTRIENVTDQLDGLHLESFRELTAYPDQTIFDLYSLAIMQR